MTIHRLNRRGWLIAAGSMLVGCRDRGDSTSDHADGLTELSARGIVPQSLSFGITPSTGQETHELLAPMARFLSARLGIPVGGTTSATYDDLQRIVSDGSVHMGIFSPAAYVTAQKAGLEAVPIATVTRNSSPTYLGCFVARAELPAPPLESFRDTRVAWVNRQSTSGYLYPRELMVARGLEPNQFFASEVFAGDHKSAVSIVAEGGAAIAAVAAPFVDPDAGMRVQGADKLVVVAKTRRIPLDCVVVHHRIQRDFAETLQRALFALSSDREASLALSRSWGLGGFVRPMIERYAEVAASLAAAEGVSAPILDSQDR